VSPQLKGFASHGIGGFKIPDLLFHLQVIDALKDYEGSNNARAYEKAERYFLFDGHKS
jgi:hypothetical protein